MPEETPSTPIKSVRQSDPDTRQRFLFRSLSGQSALADVAQALLLPGTVGSVVGEVTGSLVRALRERRQSVRALAGCTRLADLLQAEPDGAATLAVSKWPSAP